ncbi:hypothetical protein C4564_03465 [Candidatus Microgenomates bacterium]|nr:MAG: hypothetical protein C4564_03465 [Candidatus Microgenomates bacterium]
MSVKAVVRGYMPEDVPPFGALLSLAVQQVLTMFPATVLVAILTKMDVGATLFTSGIGTIIALLVSRRRIPMYYGSSFSYIAVIMAAMIQFVPDCFNDVTMTYCPEGVRLVQAGIIGTGVLEILLGLLIVRVGKAALDKVLPASITGPVALLIGLSLAGAAINMAAANWAVALVTLAATILASVYLQGKGLLGMLPIVIGAAVGYAFSVLLGIVDFSVVDNAAWVALPNLTLPVFDGVP